MNHIIYDAYAVKSNRLYLNLCKAHFYKNNAKLSQKICTILPRILVRVCLKYGAESCKSCVTI